jgi:hypothetical protein
MGLSSETELVCGQRISLPANYQVQNFILLASLHDWRTSLASQRSRIAGIREDVKD